MATNQLNQLKVNDFLCNDEKVEIMVLKKHKNEEYTVIEKNDTDIKPVIRKPAYFKNKEMKLTNNNSFMYLSNLETFLDELSASTSLKLAGCAVYNIDTMARLYNMKRHNSYVFYIMDENRGIYTLMIEDSKAKYLIHDYFKVKWYYDFDEEFVSISYYKSIDDCYIPETNCFYVIDSPLSVESFRNGFFLNGKNGIKIMVSSKENEQVIFPEKQYDKVDNKKSFISEVRRMKC